MIHPHFNPATQRMEFNVEDIQSAIKTLGTQIETACKKQTVTDVEKDLPLSIAVAKTLSSIELVATDSSKQVSAYRPSNCLFKEQPCKELCEALHNALNIGIAAKNDSIQRSAAQLINIMKVNEPKHESHKHFSAQLFIELKNNFADKPSLAY